MCSVWWISHRFLALERVIYYWDKDLYHSYAVYLWDLWKVSPAQWQASFLETLELDYNGIFTLIYLPVFSFFGAAREVFITTNALFLLIVALLAGEATRLSVRGARAGDRGFAVLAVLSAPALWQPVLDGYPDVLATVCVGVGVLAFLGDPSLGSWKRLVVLGISSGFAFVIRRHFAYAVLALDCAIGITTLLMMISAHTTVRAVALRLGGLLLLAALTLLPAAVLTPGLLRRAATVNYNALYASYQISAAAMSCLLVERFGVVPLSAALAGFVWATRTAALRSGMTVFWAVFGGSWILAWCLLAREPSVQYVLHVLPFVYAFGLALLGRTLAELASHRWRVVFCVLLACSASQVVLPVLGTQVRLNIAALWPLPLRPDRTHVQDLERYQHLAASLKRMLPVDSALYVAASSPSMHTSLVEILLGRNQSGHASVASAPEVDSRDFLPISTLVTADYVLVATPAQYHLGAHNQRVVGNVVEAFTAGRGVARDFQATGWQMDFAGSGGFQLRLFRRTQPTRPEAVIEALREETAYIGFVPGGQEAWIPLQHGSHVSVGAHGMASLRPDAEVSPRTLQFLSYTAWSGEVTASGRSDPHCPLPELELVPEDGPHQALLLESYGRDGSLRWSGQTPAGADVHLLVSLPAVAGCALDDLRMSAAS